MIVVKKPFISKWYWQAAKGYKWPVFRLSIMLTILAILIVSNVPATYQGKAEIQFPTHKMVLSSSASLAFVDAYYPNKIMQNYQTLLSENIAKRVANLLKKFSLNEIDRELQRAISTNKMIGQFKQKIRAVLPFMPQQDLEVLSPKQLKILKNNYTVEHIIKNLHVRYSSSQTEVYVEYKDRSATFSMVIAKLAADSYVQSVIETKMQLFELGIAPIKQHNSQEYSLSNHSDSPILIGKYSTNLLKPNKTLIVILSFLLSILVVSLLVLILDRLKANVSQQNLFVGPHKEL